MPDNLHQRGTPDRERINVSETWEIAYWTQRLGVTADQLRAAVRAVGPRVADVRRHLRK